MDQVEGSTSPSVPPTLGGEGGGMQTGTSGQDTPSESSDADSSGSDTTGDEDGWESGESSASLVVKRHSHLHGSSHNTHSNAHHRVSIGGASKKSLPREDKDKKGGQKSNSNVSTSRSSSLFRSPTFNT